MSALRPSNLPKLAECACYEPALNPGPAAERGTALDAAFRAAMCGEPMPELQPDDKSAVEWAVTTLRALAGGSEVITREEDCRVVIPGLPSGGTADAIMPDKLAHADLKTGQKYNYLEQMAAYALGLMEQHFATEWTAHLLFCDQRAVVTHRFKYDTARGIVETIIARYNDPHKVPTPCDYCDWCAKRETCPARLALVEQAQSVIKPEFDFEAVLADNDKLGRFLTACSVLDEFRERAQAVAKERLQAGAEIPGWQLVERRGSEYVDHVTVGHYIKQMGFGAVLAAYGNLSGKKFRELWEQKMPADKPFPEEIIQRGATTVALRATKTKPNKKNERN